MNSDEYPIPTALDKIMADGGVIIINGPLETGKTALAQRLYAHFRSDGLGRHVQVYDDTDLLSGRVYPYGNTQIEISDLCTPSSRNSRVVIVAGDGAFEQFDWARGGEYVHIKTQEHAAPVYRIPVPW